MLTGRGGFVFFELRKEIFSLVLGLRPPSVSFALVVLMVGIWVLGFALRYIKRDPQFVRFCALLFLFVFAMLLLILRQSPFILFLGWDGLGISSFLLILYYQN